MVEFYRQMLVLHRAPSVALRGAQDFVRSHPRWAQPYFWAGFQLISMNPATTNAAMPQQGRTLQ
jgi:CHAT domain-containing protein